MSLETQLGLQGHVNSAEHWLRQADNFGFPHPARTECLQLASVHALLAQAIATATVAGRAGRKKPGNGSDRQPPGQLCWCEHSRVHVHPGQQAASTEGAGE